MKKVTKKTLIFNSLQSEFPNNKFRYTDVVRTAYELTYGQGTFTRKNRGYYSAGMAEGGMSTGFFKHRIPTGVLRKPGREPRYLVKNIDGTYSVTI